jgi:ketosteroid isomerase-like protein
MNPESHQAGDPAVLYAYANAYNSGDPVAAAARFTENAVWVSPRATGPVSQQTPGIGRTAILTQLQNGALNHNCLTILDTAVVGSLVTATVEVRGDNMRAGGVDRIRVGWLVQVSEDKIAALYVLHDLTDPQTNEWRAIQAGSQAAGAPLPDPAIPGG